MTDQTTPPVQTDNNDGQPIDKGSEVKPNNGKTPISQLPPDIQTYIEELRTEAESYRKAKKAADEAAKKAEEKRLADQQEWQKLAETRAQELAKLQPVADQYEAITQAFNASLDNRLKQIPEDVRKEMVDPVRGGMSPVDFSNWLDRNLSRLAARQAPAMDGGAGGSASGGQSAPKLTPSQQAMLNEARNAGYDIDPVKISETAKQLANQRRRFPKRDSDEGKE